MTNTIDFDKAKRIIEKSVEKTMRATALKVLGIVDLRTPVDEGTLRANNRVSLDTPITQSTNKQDPSGTGVQSEIDSILRSYTLANTIIMHNPLDYAIHVEEGTQYYRGAFMYRSGIAAAKTALNQASQQNRIKD